MKFEFKKIKEYQHAIILAIGYLAILAVGFGLGRMTFARPAPPEIKIVEAFAPPNNNENLTPTQSIAPTPAPAATSPDCAGKIKGNIGSGGTKIYHVPGGSFYNRTIAEMCFNTEDEAKAAGFRRSTK